MAVNWDVDADPSIWLQVPYFDDDAESEQWLDQAAEAVVSDFAADYTLGRDYPTLLRVQLGILLDLAREKEEYGNLFAHLPGPNDNPFPVFVCFDEPREEATDYLAEIAGATGLPAVRPPIVESVMNDTLGEGIRVVRVAPDPEFGTTTTLCYAWRAFDTDVFVFAQSNDQADLDRRADDITGLIASIHPVPQEGADGGG